MKTKICGMCDSKYHTSYQHTDTMMKSEDDVRKELIKEFNLSERMYIIDNNGQHLIMEKDVKEFIRILKDFLEAGVCMNRINEIQYKIIRDKIDKLAGERVNGNK